MRQICKFDTPPATIANGGYRKGKYIIWLNLSVSEIEAPENETDKFQSITDRLTLSDHSIEAFLEAVDELHLALATNEELMRILEYFQTENDIESWKALRIRQISGYDQTDRVNCFFLEGQPLWLDKGTRVGLVNSIAAEKRDGCVTTDLWFGNNMIQLQVDDAMAKLDQIELYAKNCYNVTAKHQAEIMQMESLEELQQYDITAGYPSFLELNIKK